MNEMIREFLIIISVSPLIIMVTIMIIYLIKERKTHD